MRNTRPASGSSLALQALWSGLTLCAATALAVALFAAPAGAVVPSPVKITAAIAEANDKAGRSVPLWFEVAMQIGDSEAVATGVLASHPTGLARLELNSRHGFVERHLLQGNAYRASRDGALSESPQPLLPPLFFLQASDGAMLEAALRSFGIAIDEAVLGRIGDRDCYVVGGRNPLDAEGTEAPRASIWVDHRTFEVLRIDRSDGVSVRFGPAARFDGILAPSWIAIEIPDKPTFRFEVTRVAPADAPAAAFALEWLTAPATPPAPATPAESQPGDF